MMKLRLSFLVLSFVLTLSILTGCTVPNQPADTSSIVTTEGREIVTIADVIDGDTVKVGTVNGTETVRLLLVDTPESVHPDKPEQPFGKDASDFVTELLYDAVTIELERGYPDKDKYERTLGYLWVDGELLNERLLEEGYARVAYVYEPNTKYLERLQQAETHAKEKGVNIWNLDEYVTDKGFDESARP